MPSFTYGVAFGVPKSRSLLVSFSVNSSGGVALACRARTRRARRAIGATTAACVRPRAAPARAARSPHDQVLRNHSVGSTCKLGRSGPRLRRVISDQDVLGRRPSRTRRTRRSSGRRRRCPCRAARTRVVPRPRPRLVVDQVVIGIGRLRVLVQILHVRVRRRAVEVEVVLLDVLAVVALAVGQPEQPLLEDRVAAVPQRQREAELLLVVARCRRGRPRPSGRRASAPGRG